MAKITRTHTFTKLHHNVIDKMNLPSSIDVIS